MSDPLFNLSHYTYKDYLTFPDDVRCELIDGVVYMMAGPSIVHQTIQREIGVQIANFLRGKPCQLFFSQTDVRLNADTADDTVVQPDILVVCDKKKLHRNSVVGAPDLAIEILSPSSIKMDQFLKQRAYLRAGVREYWIVDPIRRIVNVLLLEAGKYFINYYMPDETVPVTVLPGCTVSLATVFPPDAPAEPDSDDDDDDDPGSPIGPEGGKVAES